MVIVFVYKSVILQRCLSLASGMSQTKVMKWTSALDSMSSKDSMSELEPV